MAVTLWIFAGLFWVCVIAKHFWMKDETRAKRTRAWDYPALDRLSRILDWVFAPLTRREKKKREHRDTDIVAWLGSKGVRAAVRRDPRGEVEIFIHQDDQHKLAALFDELGFPEPEYVTK